MAAAPRQLRLAQPQETDFRAMAFSVLPFEISRIQHGTDFNLFRNRSIPKVCVALLTVNHRARFINQLQPSKPTAALLVIDYGFEQVDAAKIRPERLRHIDFGISALP